MILLMIAPFNIQPASVLCLSFYSEEVYAQWCTIDGQNIHEVEVKMWRSGGGRKKWGFFEAFKKSNLRMKGAYCRHIQLLNPRYISAPRRIPNLHMGSMQLLHAFCCHFDLILPLCLTFSPFPQTSMTHIPKDQKMVQGDQDSPPQAWWSWS